MHKKNIFISLALAAAVAMGASATASAAGQDSPGGGPAHGGPHGPGRFGHHGFGGGFGAFRQLDLSDAQKASIKQIFKNSFGQDKSQFVALAKQRKAFGELKPTDPGYQAAASSLAQAEASATQARVLKEANIRAQIYAVLTPAQQAKLATIKADAEARRQQWKAFRKEHPLPNDAQQAQ